MSQVATPVTPQITYSALLGRIIEHRRKQVPLTQEPIATALGITQSAYSRLEKGQSAMSLPQLRIIASHLGATPGEVVSEADQYAAQFELQGGRIVSDREESSAAGLLVALGILAALFAAGR